jgi:dihydroorotase
MNYFNEVTVLANVLIPGGRVADITLSGGVITHVGSSEKADIHIRCNNLTVIPAGIDMHVHMRDGNQSAKEDWKSGTKSALAGGITTVIDQPNTIPPITNQETFVKRVNTALKQSYCHFGINAGVTADADLEGMSKAGAMAFGETFAGPSSYAEALRPPDLEAAIERIAKIEGLLTVHAENVSDGDDDNVCTHDKLRSAAGELEAVRMVEKLNQGKTRIHFCHISSAQTVREINAKKSGTIEVTPHHLFLSYDSLDSLDTRIKVNPPVRNEKMRSELFAAWNLIDVIASDHAPHTLQEKNEIFSHAPSGIPGVQTMIPLLMAEMQKGRVSLPDVIEKTSLNPANILGIPPGGYETGMRADFALYSTTLSKISTDELYSKAGWTPFEGMPAIFPEQVIMGGQIVFDKGDFEKGNRSWLKGRGYIHRA